LTVVAQLVNVAVQVQDGDRVIYPFTPETSLWSILRYAERQSNGQMNITQRAVNHPTGFMGGLFASKETKPQYYMQPVCNILNQEVDTLEQQRRVTLASLGVASGNVVVRVLLRPTTLLLDEVMATYPPDEQADVVVAPTPTVVKRTPPTVSVPVTVEAPEPSPFHDRFDAQPKVLLPPATTDNLAALNSCMLLCTH
jgi:hypothetical protein